MCRVAAFPPNFPKDKALEILEDFYIGNEDGTGSVYVKDNKFIANRYNFSFAKVVKRGLPLLEHMPYNGWTLAHVRSASHGGNTIVNTHPFIKRDVAMVHNGIFDQYDLVKAALSSTHKFRGQTDSEVAAVLWNRAGRDKFRDVVRRGVYMFLNRDGRVDVVGNEGSDLVFQNTKWGTVMASELPPSFQRKVNVLEGYFKLGRGGRMIFSDWKKDKFMSYDHIGYKLVGDTWRKVKKTSKAKRVTPRVVIPEEFPSEVSHDEGMWHPNDYDKMTLGRYLGD